MKIIKKFPDYYDISLETGIDTSCIYNRTPFISPNKSEFLENYNLFKDKFFYIDNKYNTNNNIEYIKPFIIGFCGKTYVGYAFKYKNITTPKIIYSINNFLKLYDFNTIPKGKYYKYTKSSHLTTLTEFYDKYHNKPHSLLFTKYHIPIFVIDYNTKLNKIPNINNNTNTTIIFNPCLTNYEFYKIFPANIAFQEIQMYLQGVLGNKEKEIINISNENKIIQHGMNKWSFRNPDPPKRKQKQK